MIAAGMKRTARASRHSRPTALELLNVPESWVREHTRSGRIPHVQLGRYVRYRQEAVVKWVCAQEETAFRKHRPRI